MLFDMLYAFEGISVNLQQEISAALPVYCANENFRIDEFVLLRKLVGQSSIEIPAHEVRMSERWCNNPLETSWHILRDCGYITMRRKGKKDDGEIILCEITELGLKGCSELSGVIEKIERNYLEQYFIIQSGSRVRNGSVKEKRSVGDVQHLIELMQQLHDKFWQIEG